MSFWTWVIIIILVIYIISKRNECESLRQGIKHAGSQISNYIEKRNATLNDALNIAKIGYADEVKGIEQLTCEQQLEQLRYLGEKYPSLCSIGNYSETLNQAFMLNADITAAREVLNGNIRNYNETVNSFPGNLIAKLFGYKEEKFIDEENIQKHRHLPGTELDFSKFRN